MSSMRAQHETATKFRTVIKFHGRKILSVDHTLAIAKILVTRMLTRDVLAVGNILVT